MRTLKAFAATLALALALAGPLALHPAPAEAQVYYTINGQPASAQVQLYLAQNGLPPGHYWLNTQGYWGVVGNPNPLGNVYAGTSVGRGHSGEQARNGWVHRNDNAGTWVGGDANGCIYTPNWSNC